MKKTTIAILGAAALAVSLAAGYFFSVGSSTYGMLLGAVGALLLWFLISRMRSSEKKAAKTAWAFEHPAISLAFYSELSRLIDEGKDINAQLRSCGAPQNIVKSVNIGGATRWYYHKDGMPYNEFCADIPAGETPAVSHPNVTAQRTDMQNGKAVHVITVDLYRALWDWGEQHPEKRRYANSMRIAFHGAYKPDTESGGNSYLDKSIESVRSARKANKKKPKKKRRDTDPK